jgi:hypothetical protein
MGLFGEVRDELASLTAGDMSELAVAVVIGGTPGTGLRVNTQQTTEFAGVGETGVTSATVRVSAATFSKPTRGATIRVGGEPAIVTQVDGSGALWVIQYRLVRPVEGV